MKNENIVHVVEEYDMPRYEMRVRDDCSDECEMAIEDVKNYCKLWVKSRDYSNLTNVEGDFDDLAGFQSAIGDEYVDGRPYEEIVEIARKFIYDLGGFEKFAEWGLY